MVRGLERLQFPSRDIAPFADFARNPSTSFRIGSEVTLIAVWLALKSENQGIPYTFPFDMKSPNLLSSSHAQQTELLKPSVLPIERLTHELSASIP
jgi:hypothetical protein